MDSVSLDDRVWVRLTRQGERVYRDYLRAVLRGSRRTPEAAFAESNIGLGWRMFLLHELMTIFGSAIAKTTDALFEKNEIRLTRP